jgi:hypothetical protein
MYFVVFSVGEAIALHAPNARLQSAYYATVFFKYWSIAIRISALTGAPVFSEMAPNFFS